MKHICLLVAFLSGFFNVDYLLESDRCSEFKRGKFISSYVKRAGFTGYILRPNDSVQIEHATFNNFTVTNHYRVKWYSSCHYTLYFIKTDSPNNNPFVKNDSIEVRIEHVLSDTSIAYRSIFKGQIMYDTLMKVK